MEVLRFEHDEPIYTPKISGLITVNKDNIECKLGIIKTINQNREFVLKHVYSYNKSIPGVGYCINTYDFGGNCNPFCDESYFVRLFDDIDTLVNFYWNIIAHDKRVGLYAKYINIKNGTITERIINERV